MSSELRRWAATEHQLLEEDAKWLRAGARLLSPSGDDITATKLAQLEDRLRQLQDALGADS
jgi:hypothetical protein